MREYARYAVMTLAATAIAVGAYGVMVGARVFTVWSVALFVAAVVFEFTAKRSGLPTRAVSAADSPKTVSSIARRAESASAPVSVSPLFEQVATPLEPAVDSCSASSEATTQQTTSVAAEVAAPMDAAATSALVPDDGSLPSRRPMFRAPSSVEPVDVAVAFQQAASAAGEVLSAHLWLEDVSSGTLRLIASCGTLRPTGDPEPIEGSCLGDALSRGTAVLCPEMIQNAPAGERTVWRYALPLSSGDARGVASVDVVSDEPDRAVLTEAGSALRSALTGALALHVAREQTRASNTLLEATSELSRLVDPEAVTEALLKRAIALSSAQTGSVMLLGDDGRLSIANSVGLPDDVALVTSTGEGEGIAGWVLTTGQPVVVEDLEAKGPRSRRHGIRSAVSVPIADDDGILGVLNVGNRTFRARFSSSHRDSLETLGRIGALALRTARALKTSQELYFDTLKALAVALETKDPYARGGTARVVDLSCKLAEALGMSEREQTAVRIASLLHDVGMSAAGDVVAVSDRPLSTVEWGLVKVHPVIAADVLEQAPALREAIPIVYHHHERFDGDGYVVGLAAQTIPLGARVLAVADSYVAMTSDRPYRGAMSAEAALKELRGNAGTQFDPDVVTALECIIGDVSKRPASR